MGSFDPKILQSYPEKAGVYIMKNEAKDVLYVGKAKNLKKRLKQYFLKRIEDRPQIEPLIKQVDSIETIVVDSEKEALLLENTLIKKFQPKYNILLRDDKTYVSLCLTSHHYPMIRLVRYKSHPPKDKNLYFGPYTHARAAKETLDLIQKLFPLRQCSDRVLISRKRPCILYSLKRCIAPCVKKCTDEEYAEYVKRAEKLLKGLDKEIVKDLKEAMKKSSENLLFEEAQKYRDLIHKIEHVTEVQHVDNQKVKECDVIGFFATQNEAMIVVLHYRNYKLVGSTHFSFSNILVEKENLLSSFLMQYLSFHLLPREIIIPFSLKEGSSIEKILEEKFSKTLKLTYPKKGEKKHLLSLALKNALSIYEQQKALRLQKEKILLELEECLHLIRYPRQIDCFDISHISEKFRIGAKITYLHGKRAKELTRYYKIQTESLGDVYALKEVLSRYLVKAKNENHLPDLLILDGGKQQLQMAQKVLFSLDIATIDLIGIAKEKALHTKGLTQEKIFVLYQKDPIVLSITSPLLHFLQNIRDETHQVAIQFHRSQRTKALKKTFLDEIPGIGPIKKKKILQNFSTKEKILAIPVESFSEKTGLSLKEAHKIQNFLKISSKH